MYDTLRVLVDWKCNLKCRYCCNEQPRFRWQFRECAIDSINWNDYKTVCISGGEPLLFPGRVLDVLRRTNVTQATVLYTNGTLCDVRTIRGFQSEGLRYVNVGLHSLASFKSVIERVCEALAYTSLRVRFQAQTIFSEYLLQQYPNLEFKFWEMDYCDRDNEDRVVLV